MAGEQQQSTQDFLQNLAGDIADDPQRSVEQLEEQAGLEEQHEAEARAEPHPEDADLEASDREAGEQPAGEEGRAPPRHVPVAELQAERQKRQQAEAREQALEQRLQALEQRMSQPQQPAQPAPQLTPEQQAIADERKALGPKPDYLDDPAGVIEWQEKSHALDMKELRLEVASSQQQSQANITQQQVRTLAQRAEAAFVGEHPDYLNALNHARQQVFRETKAEATALGIQVTDQQIVDYVANQETALMHNLVARGINPALYVYTVAQQRYGYVPPKPNGQDGQPVQAQQQQTPAPGADQAARAALRGLPAGDTALNQPPDGGSVPFEFTQAFQERFGRTAR